MRVASVRLPLSTIGCALLFGAIGWLAARGHNPAIKPAPSDRAFHAYHEHVLGTSLEIWMNAADQRDAQAAEEAILTEIDRLRKVFSLYDPESELCRLNRTRLPLAVSSDLLDVLLQYDMWQDRSGGALNGRLGGLVEIWKQAEKEQRLPDDGALSELAKQASFPGWRIDAASSTVRRLTEQPLNLNAIGKGYIIQRAAAAAQAAVPSLAGLLINLGGDIAARGDDVGNQRGWLVGVQNPREPYDNAKPLTRLRLANHAVATSGDYERYYTVEGKRYSHLLDPRTGRPAPGTSATVIAADNATANALATTLCILAPAEGLKLIAATPHAECLIVSADGARHRSNGFALFEAPALLFEPVSVIQVNDKDTEAKRDAVWPDGYEVRLTVTLPESGSSKKYRRPYVAVWVENTEAKPVRTITEWGNDPRWIKELPQWWKFAKNDSALVRAVSRATRPPGKHNLVWDGADDHGKPLPQGTYTIQVEVHREHGKLVRQSGKIACAAEPSRITLPKNAETGDTTIEYAKKKAP